MEVPGTALFTDEELLDALSGAVLPLETVNFHDLAGSFGLLGSSIVDSSIESLLPLTLNTVSHSPERDSPHAAKRITPKQEIEKLRAVSATLEEKMCELKRRRESNGSSEDTPFWKRVAIRIANEKSEAQQENLRLRTLVNTHKSTIQTITRSIESVAQLSSDFNVRSTTLQETYRPLGADEAYEQTFANVAAAHAELDAMIQNSQLEIPVTLKRTRQVQIDMQQSEGAQSIRIRLEEARLVPFTFTMTTARAWDFLCRFNEAKDRNGLVRYFTSDGSSIYGVCPLYRSLMPAQQDGQIVIRRFLERDRVVFVWVISVAGEGGHTSPMKERGWCIFEPGMDDPTRSTLCRIWTHFVPQTLASHQEVSEGSAIGFTADTVVGVYDETVGSLRDTVLSSLVENLSLSEDK